MMGWGVETATDDTRQATRTYTQVTEITNLRDEDTLSDVYSMEHRLQAS